MKVGGKFFSQKSQEKKDPSQKKLKPQHFPGKSEGVFVLSILSESGKMFEKVKDGVECLDSKKNRTGF